MPTFQQGPHEVTTSPEPRWRLRHVWRVLRALFRYSRHVAEGSERTQRDVATLARSVVRLAPGGRAALVLAEVTALASLVAAAIAIVAVVLLVVVLDGWWRMAAFGPGVLLAVALVPLVALGPALGWLWWRADREVDLSSVPHLGLYLLDIAGREHDAGAELLAALGPRVQRLLGLEDVADATAGELAEAMNAARARLTEQLPPAAFGG